MYKPFFQSSPPVAGEPPIIYVRLWDDDRPAGQRAFGPMASGMTQAEALKNLQLQLETVLARSGAMLRKIAALQVETAAALTAVRATRGIR